MNRRSTKRKKRLVIILLIVAVSFLIIYGAVILRKPKPVPLSVPSSDATSLDLLFYSMGIQQIPSVAPPVDILLKDVDGNRVRISDLKGKILFLNFWATWCPGCLIEMPSMEKLHQRFKDKEFIMIAISMQEPADRVKQFLKKNKLSFTTLLDAQGNMGSRFGAFSIPTTYIFDRDGKVIGRAVGARDWYSETSISLFEYLTATGNPTSFEYGDR